MAFGRKKKAKHASEEVEDLGEEVAPKKRARDTLASVVDESVAESAVEDFKANENFHLSVAGHDVYVGLLLNTDDIGGLSKRATRKDEAKGQILELISSGAIKTYVPAELLALDKLIIIPDADTLSSMEEFSLLTDAPYAVALVDADGSVADTGKQVTFAQVQSAAADIDDVAELLHGLGIAVDGLDDDDDADADDADDAAQTEPEEHEPEADATTSIPAQSVASDVADVDELDDDVDELDDDELEDGLSDDDEDATEDELEAEPAHGGSHFATPDDADVDDSDDEVDDEEAEEETVVSPEDFSAAIKRKFYSDDLRLEVSTEPFDAQFLHQNPPVLFEEHRSEGWLNNYLNELSRDANLELTKLHHDHLFSLRNDFYTLMGLHAETIAHELDPDLPDTQYGQLSEALKRKRIDDTNNVAEEVSRRRGEVDKSWNSSLETVGERAKQAAQAAYEQRYGAAHKDELFRIEPAVRDEIENAYVDNVRDMNERRRADAGKRMDYGITEALKDVSERYQALAKDEAAAYGRWRDRINAFLDDHRKDDFAHDKALADELAQSEKADKVMADYTERLQAQAAEFAAKASAMKEETEQTKRECAKQIADLNAAHELQVAKLDGEANLLQGRIDGLVTKYAELDEKKSAEYEKRITTYEDEQKAMGIHVDQLVAAHKHANVVGVALACVAIVASLAIGVIVGSNLNLSFGSEDASTQVVESFDSRMDELEKKIDEANSTKSTASASAAPQQTPEAAAEAAAPVASAE